MAEALRAIGLILLASPLAWATDPPTPQSGLVQYTAQPQSHLLPDEEIPRPGALGAVATRHPPSEAQRREQALWRLLGQGRLARLDQVLARMREDDPLWRPPQRLLRELERQRQAEAIRQARRERDWPVLLRLAHSHPQRFDCGEVHHLWDLADAYLGLGESEPALRVYQRIIEHCDDAAKRLITLQRAEQRLPVSALQSLVERESARPRRPAEDRAYSEFRYGVGLRLASDAYARERFADALAHLGPLEDGIVARRDADAASLLAWVLSKGHHPHQALGWFGRAARWSQTPDRRYELALAYFETRDLGGAADRAQPLAAQDPRAARLMRDIALAQAHRAYRGGDYARALGRLDEARHWGDPGHGDELLGAWSRYQLGEYRAAEARFIDLYRAQPDEESARGLVFSALKQDDLAPAYALGETMGGRLAKLIPSDEVKPLLARGYDWGSMPLEVSPSGRVRVDNARVEVSSLGLGRAFSARSGDPGLSRLRTTRFPVLDLRYLGDVRNPWRLRLDRLHLDSGSLHGDDPIGSDPVVARPFSTTPTTELDQGLEGMLHYRHRGERMLFAGIGFTPLGGEVSPTLQGRLGSARSGATQGWRGTLFRVPVRESLLSYTGLRDPYSGERWGRVLSNGVEATGYRALGRRWSLGGSLGLAWLTGRDVKANRKLSLYTSLSRNLEHEGLQELALGPFLLVQSYAENLRHFTRGHGGYFSPQRLVNLGLGARLQTLERRPYLVRARADLGFQAYHEDATPLFPKHPDGRRFSGNDDRGLNLQLQLASVSQIGATPWQAGIRVQAQLSPQYNDYATYAFVRYLFGGRRTTLSSDLPGEDPGAWQ